MTGFYLKYNTGIKWVKGAYIKYVRVGGGGFYRFYKNKCVAQRSIKLNILWPGNFFEKKSWCLPSILVSCFLCVVAFQGSIHCNIQNT